MRHIREDLRVPDAKAEMYLLGLGIGGFEQRTVEVDEILKDAALVIHLTAFDQEIRRICTGRVLDLNELYFANPDASDTYESITQQLLSAASDHKDFGSTCFLTYGHPLMLVDSSWDFVQRAAAEGISVKAIAATSYLDQVLCDLEYRFDSGFQVYESNRFMVESPQVDIRFPLVVPQVGEVGTDQIGQRTRILEWLDTFSTRINSIYPQPRMCHLIFSAYRSDMAPKIITFKTSDINSIGSHLHSGSTLVIEGE